MNIIAVDDEHHALWTLEQAIKSVEPAAQISCFDSASQALEYAKSNPIDIAFLDIDMDEMNGLALAKRLKDIHGKTNIIFVTGYAQYKGNALDLRASGYVLKPINPARVREELDNLRNPVEQIYKGIYIRCFGGFEVFSDGKPVIFRRPKAKEALAYLVHRKGASVSKKTLAAILWEDKLYTRSLQSHLYKLITEIEKTLADAGAPDIIVKHSGIYYVEASKFSCDYYAWDACNASAVNMYHGEYMANYSWGEFTAGFLDRGKK